MNDACWLILLLGKIANTLGIDRGTLMDVAYKCAEEMIREEKENACK
ncbi:MAG: hypothetical protein IJP78_07720 [Clostridia bacterium]|nr:hypothetical protein [Clostridia bacterium]